MQYNTVYKQCMTVLSVWVQKVTDNKQRISELKSAIEQRRVQRSMASLADPAAPQEPDSVEENAKAQIEQVSHAVYVRITVTATLLLDSDVLPGHKHELGDMLLWYWSGHLAVVCSVHKHKHSHFPSMQKICFTVRIELTGAKASFPLHTTHAI